MQNLKICLVLKLFFVKSLEVVQGLHEDALDCMKKAQLAMQVAISFQCFKNHSTNQIKYLINMLRF